MKKTVKESQITINLHVPRGRENTALACVRLLNRHCHNRMLEVVTVSVCRWHVLVAVRLFMQTCECHEVRDLLAGLYFIVGRCDCSLEDVNITHK